MEAPLGTFANPRPYDILCGRNRNSFNNIGNRRFRITISMNVEKYNAMRSRHERSKFIASLAQTLRYEVGFRFLKRTTTPAGSNKNNKQHHHHHHSGTAELSDEEIRAKIGHALRDLSTAMQQNGGDQATPESKVPRPGPYKKQDKKFQQQQQQKEPLPIVSSASSLETMSSSSSAQESTTLDGTTTTTTTQEDKKPSPVPSSSSQQLPSSSDHRMNTITEQDETTLDSSERSSMPSPDPAPSAIIPPPLKSSLNKSSQQDIKELMSTNKEEADNSDNLKVFPLDIGEACQSLLNTPPVHLIPSSSLDNDDNHNDEDDEDYYEMINDFWSNNNDEMQNNNENSSHAKGGSSCNMSIGGASSHSGAGYDMMSLPSSCCLSDAMETLSLVSTS